MKLVLKYLPTALHLIVLAVGIDTVSKLHKEYIAARELRELMEEDLTAPLTFGTSWDCMLDNSKDQE